MAFGLREEIRWTVPRRLGSTLLMGIASRDALHRNGCRNFHPRFASGPFPRRERFSSCQQWNCPRDLGRACGRSRDIVCGQATGVEVRRLNQDLGVASDRAKTGLHLPHALFSPARARNSSERLVTSS